MVRPGGHPTSAERERLVIGKLSHNTLLCLWLLLLPVGNAGAEKTCKLGMIMPITNDPTGAYLSQDFLSLTCAAKLAVKHVNEGTNTIVPGLSDLVANLTHLNVTLYDTGFSESPAIMAYRQLLATGEHALVGAARSAVSQPLAMLGKIDKLPQC
eukprot:2793771-Prymnesium_polylepis.1